MSEIEKPEEKPPRPAPHEATLEEFLEDKFYRAAIVANAILQAMGVPHQIRSAFARAFEEEYDKIGDAELAQVHKDLQQLAKEGPPNPDQPPPAIMGPTGQPYQKRDGLRMWKPGEPN